MGSITVGDVTVYYETDAENNITYGYLDEHGDAVAECAGTSEYSIISVVSEAVHAQTKFWRNESQADFNHDAAKLYFGLNPYKYEAPGFFTRLFTRLFRV